MEKSILVTCSLEEFYELFKVQEIKEVNYEIRVQDNKKEAEL